MGTSNIEWTDATWNPCVGCEKVSQGCAHCYAEVMAVRLAHMALSDIEAGRDPGRKRHYLNVVDLERGRWNGKAEAVPEALTEPFGWRKPRMVFVNSMSDLFHEDLSFEFIASVHATMIACRSHTFQVLTKRPKRAWEFYRWLAKEAAVGETVPVQVCQHYAQRLSEASELRQGERFGYWEWPAPNIWLGASVERQQEHDERMPWLLACPAAVRFLSAEPLLSEVNLPWLRAAVCDCRRSILEIGCPSVEPDHGTHPLCSECGYARPVESIGWVIAGGESGHKSRACDSNWIRSIIRQCRDASVPVFVKQMGRHYYRHTPAGRLTHEWPQDKKGGDPNEWDKDLRVRQMPRASASV